MGNTLGMKEQLQHLLSQLREYPGLATGYAEHNQKKLLGETPDMLVAAMIRPGVLLQNRYRVVRQIGGGGFGQVFEVDDGGTPKVLKVLSLERFGSPTIKNKAIALFSLEAQLLSKIQHPGIPRVEPSGYFTYPRDSSEPYFFGNGKNTRFQLT